MTEFEIKFKEKTGVQFNKYYKEYKPKLTWYLTKYTHDVESAEEFADIAFIQGLEKIDTYDNTISQFITWVTSIAINLVIKDYKDRKKMELTSLDYELKENFTLGSVLSYDDENSNKILEEENKLKCDKIVDAIYSLPDKYKKVMVMRELENKPYKTIADNIFKERSITVSDEEYFINFDEYFHSATIENIGDNSVEIYYNNEKIDIHPNNTMEISKEEEISDIKIDTNESKANILLKSTTNLSTIKSQIKKGRYLIRKKVKKDFELIEKNGVK